MRRLQLGQVLDFCIEDENQRIRAEKKEKGTLKRKATQEDIDLFFGKSRRKRENDGG